MTRDEYCASGSRLYARRGSELPHAKLNEQIVAEARRLHERKQRLIKRLNERYSAEALARRYGVSTNAMEKVLARQTWVHVR